MKKEEILRKVERNYGLGGLSDGLYAEYALDVAELYKNQELAELQKKYNKLKRAYINQVKEHLSFIDSERGADKNHNKEYMDRCLIEAGLA